MSYQVLARKWRPRFFDEMVGQEHVLRALINALNEQRLHHAYLFTGTRGVGKTTIARILAKCLNCEQGVSARPCGECSSCREIAEGRFVDLIEVDAASRTKVEDTRELLDNVQYAPTRGRFKVYLIDEVHMLSTHSFNALLKTLEEPPEHVKFLLATTDPQKLPITVLSRCLQFSLKNMTPESIVNYLETVLDTEQVRYDNAALWQLGRAAQGSMRDALSLTDQAIAFGEGQVEEHQVASMLGTMDRGRLFKLAEVMARGDAAEIMQEVADMSAHGPDFDEVVQGLMTIWHRASLGQVLPDAIENSQGDRDAVLALARAMNGEDLQLYYQIALSGRKDLAQASDPRQGFEMMLLRMLAFRPAPAAAPVLDLTTALQHSITEKKKPLSRLPSAEVASNGVGHDSTVQTASGPAVESDVEPASGSSVGSVIKPAEHELPPWDAEESAGHSNGMASMPETIPPESGSVINSEHPPSTNAASISALSALPSDVEPSSHCEPVHQNVPRSAQSMAQLLEQPHPDDIVAHSVAEPSNVNADSTAHRSKDSLAVSTHSEESAETNIDCVSELPPLAPHTWWQWLDTLPLAGLPMAIARHSALVSVSGHDYHFDVDAQQGALFNEGQRQKIEQALQTRIPGCRITMVLGVPSGETPEQRRQRLQAEAGSIAQQSIESDLAVRHIISRFNAVVLPNSIRPLNHKET